MHFLDVSKIISKSVRVRLVTTEDVLSYLFVKFVIVDDYSSIINQYVTAERRMLAM